MWKNAADEPCVYGLTTPTTTPNPIVELQFEALAQPGAGHRFCTQPVGRNQLPGPAPRAGARTARATPLRTCAGKTMKRKPRCP
ncbi:hypothetical protein ACU4GD_20830 [Cupriavidus basilensis]